MLNPDDMEEELQKKESELRKKLVREVVKAFLEKKKIAVIFEKKDVFVWDDAVDVTEEIVALYDAQKNGQ